VITMKMKLLNNPGYTDWIPVNMGREKCLPKHGFGPAIRKNYLIHYVVSGCGRFQNKNGTFPVHRGQIFLIYPGEVTFYRADAKNPWEYIWVEFHGSMAKKLDDLPCPVMDVREDLFLRMWEGAQREENAEEYVLSQLVLLIPELTGVKKEDSAAEKIEQFIESNYMQDIRIEDMARWMGYTRQHLTRIFKAYKQKSIQAYLLEVRLHHAKEFLRKGYSVSQTAIMCGYRDVFHFSRSFKQYYGASPKNIL